MNRRRFVRVLAAAVAGAVVLVTIAELPKLSRVTRPSTTPISEATTSSSSSSSLTPVTSATPTASSTSTSTTSSESMVTASQNTSTLDYQNFIAPYLNQIEMARASTMSAPNLISGNAFKIGYVPAMNMIAGDHTCLHDQAEQYCMIDPGYSIAVPLDRLNALAGSPTSLTQTYTGFLNGSWVQGSDPSGEYCCCYAGDLPYNPYGWNDPRLVPFGFKQTAIYNWANAKTSCGNAFVCAPNYNNFDTADNTPIVCVDVVDTTSVLVPDTSNGGGATAPRWSEWVLNQYLIGQGNAENTQNAINYIMNDWNGTQFETLDPDQTARVYGKMFQMIRALGLWQQNQTNTQGISWLEIAKQVEARMFGLQVTDSVASQTGATVGQFSIGYDQIGDTGGEEMGYVLTSVWDQLPSIFSSYIK